MKKIGLTLSVMAILTVAVAFTNFAFKPAVSPKLQMVADWERAKVYTNDYIHAATSEVLTTKPNPEMRSFTEQMLHIAEANFGIAATATGKASPYTFGQLEKNAHRYATKEELMKVVAESYDFVIGAIKDLDEAKFDEAIKLFNYDVTRKSAIDKAFEHQTHHRGQTTVYLRVKGIKPPEERLF